MCYVYCGAISVIAGVIGLIVIPEPKNSNAIATMKQELKKSNKKNKDNSII